MWGVRGQSMEWDEDEIVVEITADVVEVEIAETATDVTVDEEKIELEVAAPEETGLEITEDLIELELVADPEIVIEVGEGSGKAVWGFITGDLPDQTDLAAALAGKSDTGHNHDVRYFTKEEIETALAVINAALSGKSDTGHIHDDRYYTESEVDTKLDNNSGNDNYVHNTLGPGTRVEFNTLVSSPANAAFMGVYNDNSVRKINIIAPSEVVGRIGAAASNHNHDDRYYTESEMNTKLSGKSDTGHTHNNIISRGNVTAETGTTRPAVAGLSMSQAYNNGYPFPYGNVITLKGTGDGEIFVGWSGTSGARASTYLRSRRDTASAEWSSWYEVLDSGNYSSFAAVKSHTHDDRYYTESEMNTKLGEKVSKSGDTMTGRLTINGSAASSPLLVRGIQGSDGGGNPGDLYLNYGSGGNVSFGLNGAGGTILSNKAEYSGKAANVTGIVAVENGGTGGSTPLFKFKNVSIGNIKMGSGGFTQISSFKPATPAGYMYFMARYNNWSSNGGNAIQVSLDGEWIQGTPNQQINSLSIVYIYILSGNMVYI